MKAKIYAKVGEKSGRTAYRTPSVFKYRKCLVNRKAKMTNRKLENDEKIGYNIDNADR